MERLLGRFADRYVAVSGEQVEYLTGYQHLPAAKIGVVYNSVNIENYPDDDARSALRLRLGIAPTDLIVMCVAVLRPEKDHVTLFEAFALVLDSVPTARLVLVGDGPERESLGLLAKRIGISDRVLFAGHRSDAASIVSLAEVVALTSYTVENFPFCILEAMAAGVPCVVTSIGGLPEMVDQAVTGYLVEPKRPHEVAARIASLLLDPVVARNMGAAARDRLAEHFSFDSFIAGVRREVDLVTESR